MTATSLILVLLATGCLSAPADGPVRVDLPVVDPPQPSDPQLVEPLEPTNQQGAEASNDNLLFANLISHKLQDATNILGNKFNSKPGLDGHQVDFANGIFSVPPTTRERARLEVEGFESKPLSFKENIQHIVAGLFQPKPIVQTIREEEKYGNNGDKFEFAGRAIVSGAEGVSNLVNSVLEVPGTIFRQFTRAATEKLNKLGGKLIGLN